MKTRSLVPMCHYPRKENKVSSSVLALQGTALFLQDCVHLVAATKASEEGDRRVYSLRLEGQVQL